jgi:formylglycine-generating enzyme required for sulfatase activity
MIGDSLIEKIRQGIDEMEYLGIILSLNSVESAWVKREVDVAMNHEIKGRRVKVLPLVIDDCELPGFLEGKLYADFRDPNQYETELAKVLRRLRQENNPPGLDQRRGGKNGEKGKPSRADKRFIAWAVIVGGLLLSAIIYFNRDKLYVIISGELLSPPIPSTKMGKDGKEMVLVPAGWFKMGSTEDEVEAAYRLAKIYHSADGVDRTGYEAERPPHQVWTDAFYIDVHEVTIGEYNVFVQKVGHRKLPDWAPRYAHGDTHPVVGVSWADADTYCRSFDKRLPTEAQWEKAARGGKGWQYPWGNDPVDGSHANFCDIHCDSDWRNVNQDDGYQYTAPVTSYKFGASSYGIFNLAGNVWEWVKDWYDADYYSKSSDQKNPVNNEQTLDRGRVVRGGSWDSDPSFLRASYRTWRNPERLDFVGFRCVSLVPPFGH